MAKPLNWESRIGRRVRLRDLHVLFAVVQHGSMAGAGVHLGISQSAVSQAIATLEHALAVRLLDRTPRGVEPTMYGNALIRRGQAAFDELRLGVKDIEFLADPAAGEVRIGCSESISAGILPPIIERLSGRYPRMAFEVSPSNAFRLEFPELRERTADVAFSILSRPLLAQIAEDLKAEVLFDDRICLAVGQQSPWARRRKIDLADLVDASWIMPSTGAPGEAAVMEAFKTRGLPPPRVVVRGRRGVGAGDRVVARRVLRREHRVERVFVPRQIARKEHRTLGRPPAEQCGLDRHEIRHRNSSSLGRRPNSTLWATCEPLNSGIQEFPEFESDSNAEPSRSNSETGRTTLVSRASAAIRAMVG